ncbi:hypothetical protein niasHS_013120 [Heterodera schachtii]|uniref:Uncharacterized protein n=1 Tax=Heterodera schachtii TaxID=97005 RepID=A0ABD2IDC7_HETSC
MSRHKKKHKHSSRKGSKKKGGRGSASSNGSTDSDGAVGTSSTRRAKSSNRANGRHSPPSSSDSNLSKCSTASTAHCQHFPDRAKNGNNFGQIRIRKTRWGPMLEEKSETKKRRKEKPTARESDGRHRRRGKSAESIGRGKDKATQKTRELRQLLDFVDDRKQLADEVLDSLGVRTRNRIFPELKTMSETEMRRIVYGFINGISKKRIVALLQRRDFSDSSSTSDSEECPNSIPSTSSDRRNRSISNERPTDLRKNPTKTKSESWKEKHKTNKREKELEEGELISEEEMEEEEKGGGEDGSAPLAEGAAFEDEDGQSDAESQSDDGERDGQLARRQNAETQFVISLGFSPPHQHNSESVTNFCDSEESGDDDKFGQQQQRIVCILPSPSPTATIVVGVPSDDSQPSDEGEEEDNRSKLRTPPNYEFEEQSLKVKITVTDDGEDDESELDEEERGRKRQRKASAELTDEAEQTPARENGDKTPTEEQIEEDDDDDDLLIELIDECE